MPTNGTLTQKEKELVAVGASIAAGCQPCAMHHFKAVRAAGATEAEIRQAVDNARCVRNSASQIMAGLARKHLGDRHAAEGPCCSEKPLIGELVSAGAALAVNCATSLETHLKAARAAGASDRQIQTALGMARTVKKMAAKKAEAAVDAFASKTTETGKAGYDDYGCHEGDTNRPANAQAGCGCDEEESVAATAGVEAVSAAEPCCE